MSQGSISKQRPADSVHKGFLYKNCSEKRSHDITWQKGNFKKLSKSGKRAGRASAPGQPHRLTGSPAEDKTIRSVSR